MKVTHRGGPTVPTCSLPCSNACQSWKWHRHPLNKWLNHLASLSHEERGSDIWWWQKSLKISDTRICLAPFGAVTIVSSHGGGGGGDIKRCKEEQLYRRSLHILSERAEFCLQWAVLSRADSASRETRFQPQASSSLQCGNRRSA